MYELYRLFEAKKMNKRISAVISTISSSFCDFTLDIVVNKYNTSFILLWTTIGSFIIQLIYGCMVGISFTAESIIYVGIYGISMLLGYVFYVLALWRIPVALTALIESGSLFAFLIIDSICGYIDVNLWFCILFILFVFSIFLFSFDTFKFDGYKIKKIKIVGILMLLVSMFFDGLEPYLIKFASNSGANEIAINMGYYLFAIPLFILIYIKKRKETKKKIVLIKKYEIIKYILLISIFEAIYYLFGTIGYINEAVVVNAVIQEIRVFLLFILSIIVGKDKLTLKNVIAIIMGMLSIVGIYLY